MSLIFKIAAGVIIGLLVVQIFSYRIMDYENEKLDDQLTLTSGLKVRAIKLMNAIHFAQKRTQQQ